MRINPIISTTNKTNNYYNTKSNNYQITKPYANDTVCFKGAVYHSRRLDGYLEHIKEYKSLTKQVDLKLADARICLETKLGKINEAIEPLLQDNDFLLAITPEKTKNEYKREAHKTLTHIGDYDKRTYNKVWNNVGAKIRTRILNEDAIVIEKELADVSETMQDNKYTPIFNELKNHIRAKAVAQEEFDTLKSTTQTEYEAKASEIVDMAELFYGPQAGEDRKEFIKELVNRAKSKMPELGDYYASAYNSYFYEYRTSSRDPHSLKKEAVDYAYLQTFQFLTGISQQRDEKYQ